MEPRMYIHIRESPIVHTANIVVFTHALIIFHDLELRQLMKVPKEKLAYITTDPNIPTLSQLRDRE